MTDVKLLSILPTPRAPHTFQSKMHHVADFQDVVSTTDCTSAFLYARTHTHTHTHAEDSWIEREACPPSLSQNG